jgi:hypothetical protein
LDPELGGQGCYVIGAPPPHLNGLYYPIDVDATGKRTDCHVFHLVGGYL